MNRHTVKQYKREIDLLIRNNEKLAYILDAIENKEFQLIINGGESYRTVSIEELEIILDNLP